MTDSSNKQSRQQLLRDKLKAFFIHFFVSLFIVSVVAVLVFYVWYPAPFHSLFEVSSVFGLLVMVDVILGPLCTFIVYKKYKKTLKMDLTVIFVIQIMALIFGVKSIAEARPAWLVYQSEILYAVSPSIMVNDDDEHQKPPLLEQNWGAPKVVMLEDKNANLFSVSQLENYTDIKPEVFIEHKQSFDYVKKHSQAYYDFVKKNYPEAIGYIPIVSEATMEIPIALIDKEGNIMKILSEDDVE